MPRFPLIGPSYSSQSVNADCQQTMNLYPEVVESNMGNNNIVLYPSPGLKMFVDLGSNAPPSGSCPIPFTTPLSQLTGTVVGNVLTTTITVGGSLSPVNVGDTMFLALITDAAGPPLHTNSVVSIVDNTHGSVWSQVGFTQSFVVASDTFAYQIFTAISPVNFFGAMNLTVAYASSGANTATFGVFMSVNIGPLEQIIGNVQSTTTPTGPAILASTNSFVISFITNGNLTGLNVALPFHKLVASDAIIAVWSDGGGPPSYAAPAATYTPAWTQSVPTPAAVINATYEVQSGCS